MIFLVSISEVSQIQKTGLEGSICERDLRGVGLNGLPYWLTEIFVFLELLWGITQRKESIKLYIKAFVRGLKGVPGPQKRVFWA